MTAPTAADLAAMIVSEAELAALVGVTPRRIRQLAGDGTLQRTGPGRYSLADAIRAMLDAAAEAANGDLTAQRCRKVKADADLVELELARAKGEVAPIWQIEKAWANRCGLIRANLLNVPGRAVLQLLGCRDEGEFKQKLRAEIVLALTAAATAEIDPSEDPEEDTTGNE